MLFTSKGKPVAKRFEQFFNLGRDSFSRLSTKHKEALINYASNNGINSLLVDVVFTSKNTVEVKYLKDGILNIEKCLFDTETLEFYTMPIHISKENRYEDFRSKTVSELIKKITNFTND